MEKYKDLVAILVGFLLLGLVALFSLKYEDRFVSTIHGDLDQGGDLYVDRGRRAASACVPCHDLTPARRMSRVGPPLWGVYGRPAGQVAGYPYSTAYLARAAAGLVWDEASLEQFLSNPRQFIPGNKMAFTGVRQEAELADLILFLRSLDDRKPPPAKGQTAARVADGGGASRPLLEMPVDRAARDEARRRRTTVAVERCLLCHDLTRKREIVVGPPLWGVVGRRAGQVRKFRYTAAFLERTRGMTWTSANLDRFLADPKGFAPGTRMLFEGLRQESERHDAIAFLKTLH
ncbi:MAG: hypothetical protein HQL59_05890 [Magnetococcales bacterium]|nr:hypothetical protein [Magnetococcales bacterium]